MPITEAICAIFEPRTMALPSNSGPTSSASQAASAPSMHASPRPSTAWAARMPATLGTSPSNVKHPPAIAQPAMMLRRRLTMSAKMPVGV